MKFDFVPVDEHGRVLFDRKIKNLSADQANALLTGGSSLPEFLKAILRKCIEDGEIVVNTENHSISINNDNYVENDNDYDDDDTPRVLVIAPNRLG